MVDSGPGNDGFVRGEDGGLLPVIENFYTFCGQGKLMAVRCVNCNSIVWPPRGICPKCFHDKFEWVELQGRGKLLTYTVIHFPPTQFQALAPYAVGIVKLTEGPQVPGMIRNVKLEDLRIGMDLQVGFEGGVLKEWPRWPRYFFAPAD
jgi:scaffold protein (connect acetoacetyl-CoA thiolase and HMG-CoA synthase)